MGKNEGILKGSGVSLILSAAFLFLAYIFVLLGIRSVGLPSVFRAPFIIDLHKVFWVKIGLNLLPIALVLFLLGICGGFVWFWERSRGLGFAGFVLGVLGLLILLALSFAEVGMIRLALGIEPILLPIKGKLALAIIALDKFLLTPGVFLVELFFFLWGLAFLEASPRGRWAGIVFLVEILAFIVTLFLYLSHLRFLAGVGILVNAVLVTLGLILAGALLLRGEEGLSLEE